MYAPHIPPLGLVNSRRCNRIILHYNSIDESDVMFITTGANYDEVRSLELFLIGRQYISSYISLHAHRHTHTLAQVSVFVFGTLLVLEALGIGGCTVACCLSNQRPIRGH